MGFRQMRSSRLRRRRCVVTSARRVGRTEGDDDKSVKQSLYNTRVEAATGPPDNEVVVYRGEDALQENLPFTTVPSQEGDASDGDDCYKIRHCTYLMAFASQAVQSDLALLGSRCYLSPRICCQRAEKLG